MMKNSPADQKFTKKKEFLQHQDEGKDFRGGKEN